NGRERHPIIIIIGKGIAIAFFFSSRRRHTSFSRDWSSDVCSSDLAHAAVDPHVLNGRGGGHRRHPLTAIWIGPSARPWMNWSTRSEERRVGNECRSGRPPEQLGPARGRADNIGERNRTVPCSK